MPELTWTPVRNGKYYCSPACGGDCLYKDYKRACTKADALVSRLGKNWKSHISENLGWNYSVKRGNVHVLEYSSTSYIALFNTSVGKQFMADGPTPEFVIHSVLQQAQRFATALLNELVSFPDTTGDNNA